ncbi:hypothetical protein [Vibrio phage vB_VpP_HA7]|uniref:Uncharacterized protein n=1 Tax=Vibrio phage vB_VpP_HA5 TaxID=2980504 RepID=A0A977LIP1_9CAUD|nr:hypothetical protein [Vibrio phage vB_VpP_HA5]UXF57447.1 hypothetical protein [Vibrio phage vB_VpP_HA7]
MATVKKLGALAADIQSLMPDNNEGFIVPASARELYDNIMVSVIDAKGVLDMTNNTVEQALSATATPVINWTATYKDDGMDFNTAQGSVTAYAQAGWWHEFNFVCTIAGTQNRVVTATLYINDQPTTVQSQVRLDGANSPVTIQLDALPTVTGAADTFSVKLSTDQPTTVLIPRGFMQIVRKPTQ